MTTRLRLRVTLVCLLIVAATPVNALVNQDEGRIEVGGIQLLQSAENPNEYYYLPPSPYISSKLVTNEAGEEEEVFEFLFMQYVGGPDGASSGGIIHALIEFNLPSESVEELEELLQDERPGASIIGQVPLLPVVSDGTDGSGNNMGSFEVKSATLSASGASLNDKVVTSGVAPIMPGSKAVLAAKLDQTEAVLLSASFEGPTSDLSIAIHAYYQAKVSAFNARVTADMETIYTHKSILNNQQGGFTRRQLRKIVDELHQDGIIKVEVFDQSQGSGVDTSDVEKILNVVTNKLTETMFDSSTGWSAVPEYETAVEKGQISGRQKRGFLGRAFKGSGNKKYKSDNQFTVKRREDIRQQHFEMILNKETTIKVPFDTAGNLGGLFALLGDDERYFRVINMADDIRPTTLQQVNFQIDGNYIDAFKDQINFVSVRLRKNYPDGSAQTSDLLFSHDKVSAGETLQSISFPRGGDKSANWRDFEYQVRWSIRGQDTITQPEQEDEWHHSSDSTVSLNPPFQKRVIKAEVDRELLRNNDIANVVVLYGATLFGDLVASDSVVFRKSDGEAVQETVLFHDVDTPIVKRAVWNTNEGEIRERVEVVEGDYLYLIPPSNAGANN
jgi:hypothetical protein